MRLGQEVWDLQNPAFGAVLQWRFVTAHHDTAPPGVDCPLPLVFLVLPVILHAESAALVRGTKRRSGLRAFASKFRATPGLGVDALLALQRRAGDMRGLSHRAFQLATASALLRCELETGVVRVPRTQAMPARWPAEVRQLGSLAEKFGAWCGALSLYEVSTTLKVRF